MMVIAVLHCGFVSASLADVYSKRQSGHHAIITTQNSHQELNVNHHGETAQAQHHHEVKTGGAHHAVSVNTEHGPYNRHQAKVEHHIRSHGLAVTEPRHKVQSDVIHHHDHLKIDDHFVEPHHVESHAPVPPHHPPHEPLYAPVPHHAVVPYQAHDLHHLPEPHHIPEPHRLPKPHHIPEPHHVPEPHHLPEPHHVLEPHHLPEPHHIPELDHAPRLHEVHRKPHGYCDPHHPPACAVNVSRPVCFEDSDYPIYEIKAAIEKDPLFAKKFADVADQSADDLVQYVAGEQERGFHYGYYTGASKGYSPYDATHWIGPEGYLCPSHVEYSTPKRAQNVNGEWRVVVNDAHYHTQTARLEECLFPDSACRLLAPCYKTKCTQKFTYHRMLSFDPCDPYKGLFIDIYKFPSACSCHLPTPIHT